MPSAVKLREDYSAQALRALARRSKDVNQSRRLLSLCGGSGRDGSRLGGQDRRHGPADAARLGPSLQRRRTGWAHRQLDGRSQAPSVGRATGRVCRRGRGWPRSREGRRRALAGWTSSVIAERFGVEFHERYVGKLLKKLGFSHMSVRPRHPGQDERIVEAFKKTSRTR